MPIHPRSPIRREKSRLKPPQERARSAPRYCASSCLRKVRTSSRSASASGGSVESSKLNVAITLAPLLYSLGSPSAAPRQASLSEQRSGDHHPVHLGRAL